MSVTADLRIRDRDLLRCAHMARHVEDPGPFRFSEIHGPQRTVRERTHATDLMRRGGLVALRPTFDRKLAASGE